MSGLADDDEARKEIASRYVFVVTHADSARNSVEQRSLDLFKGEMKLAVVFEGFQFSKCSVLPQISCHCQ